MEADFTSIMRGFAGSNSDYDWTFVKENQGVALLQAQHPSGGTCFKIVEHYTMEYEKQLYPTDANKSPDGNSSVELTASTAYAKFDNIVKIGTSSSISSQGVIVNRAVSFDDLDSKLSSSPSFDKELVIELQRTGMNDYGGNKTALDLRFTPGAFGWNSKKFLRDAVTYYNSYMKETRIQALKDMRESLLTDYMESNVMADIIRANRKLRKQYQEKEYEGSLSNFSQNTGDGLLPDQPYAYFTIRFIDQNGDETSNLPYTVSARGAINFRESVLKTNMGKNPGSFASGATLFEKSEESKDNKHLLYRYKVNESVPHSGSFRIQVLVPEYDNNSSWANPRIKIYGGTPSSVNERGSIIETKPGVMLTSQTFRFKGMGSHHEVLVPVYREPIPNHLVMTDDGELVSKWSTIPSVYKLPRHQKITLKTKVSRLKHSTLWEKADKNSDFIINQEEYQSVEGEAARQDLNLESKLPVRKMRVELRPDASNSWLSARETLSDETDLSGTSTIIAPVGTYTMVLVSQNASGDDTENTIGKISIPAGVFYRETSINDTTPIGVVGATMSESYATLVDFKLTTTIPRLKSGMKADYGTVYAIKSLPGIETGWPNNAPTTTDETIFTELEVLLPPLPGEISLEGSYEDIDEVAEPKDVISFNETISMTQTSTGPVVTGIDPTPAGTKWNITRIAVKKNASPTVLFESTYNPSENKDQFGRENYARASIIYQQSQNMKNGDDYLVFYPAEQGDIIAYPTESVTVSTPGVGGGFTYTIDEIVEEVVDNESNNAENNSSNALPTPSEPPRIPYGEHYYIVESIPGIPTQPNAHAWGVFSAYESSEPLKTGLSLIGYQAATQEARDFIDSLNASTNSNNNATNNVLNIINGSNNTGNNTEIPASIVEYNGYYYEVGDMTSDFYGNKGWVYTVYPPEASNGEYFNQTQGIHFQNGFNTSNNAESGAQSYINTINASNNMSEAEQLQQELNALANRENNLPQAGNNNFIGPLLPSANNNNIGDGLPSTLVNQNNTVNTTSTTYINMMATTAIANSFAAGNMTYNEASSALQTQHSWSPLDVSNTLDPLTNNHNRAVSIAAEQAAEIRRFANAANAANAANSVSTTPDGTCYITTAVMKSEGHDDSPELQSMRALRDNYGKKFFEDEVSEYYEIAPSIVSGISGLDKSDEIFQELYQSYILPAHNLVIDGKYYEAHDIYRDMVNKTRKYGRNE